MRRLALAAAVLAACGTGAADCQAGRHIHGCYADFGACDAPDEHAHYGDGAVPE